jgi:hypothetical protein
MAKDQCCNIAVDTVNSDESEHDESGFDINATQTVDDYDDDEQHCSFNL